MDIDMDFSHALVPWVLTLHLLQDGDLTDTLYLCDFSLACFKMPHLKFNAFYFTSIKPGIFIFFYYVPPKLD